MSMLYWPGAEGGRPPGAPARARRRGLPRDRAPRARPRHAALELLPLDTTRREESRVLLAFLAQAAVVPELAAAADGAAQRLQEPLAARIAHAIQTGELPAHLDPEYEAIRLQLLIYGLMVELATTTTPRRHLAKWAQAILDEHIAALAALPAPPPDRATPARWR